MYRAGDIRLQKSVRSRRLPPPLSTLPSRCVDRQRLTIVQTARALGLDPRTVAAWAARSRFEPRRSRPRGSVLDPFKPRKAAIQASVNASLKTCLPLLPSR
jgi:hypothetical protein